MLKCQKSIERNNYETAVETVKYREIIEPSAASSKLSLLVSSGVLPFFYLLTYFLCFFAHFLEKETLDYDT